MAADDTARSPRDRPAETHGKRHCAQDEERDDQHAARDPRGRLRTVTARCGRMRNGGERNRRRHRANGRAARVRRPVRRSDAACAD
jgi:hypothetical protein